MFKEAQEIRVKQQLVEFAKLCEVEYETQCDLKIIQKRRLSIRAKLRVNGVPESELNSIAAKAGEGK